MPQKQLLQSAGDGTSVPSGCVGEKITFTQRSLTPSAVQTWKGTTLASATLQPGIWLIIFYSNTPCQTNLTTVNHALSTDTTDSNAGIVSNAEQFIGSTTNRGATVNIVPYIANLSTATSFYGKVYCNGATTTVTFDGYAVRIA